MAESLSNLGYMAIGEEATVNTAVIPAIFVPLYKESMTTDTMLDIDSPIAGQKYKNFAVYQGQREHKGSITVLGEPNTAGFMFNMVLNKTSTGGSNPYTHTFNSTSSSDASTYTVDFLKGRHVYRYFGVRGSSITPSFNKNKMELDLDLHATGAFTTREVASVSGSGPYTITLKTNYDAAPTTGLVATDVMQWYKVSDGSYTNFTVASVASTTTITTSTNVAAIASGDIISLRAQTVSLSLVAPFTWSGTEFRISDTAANALSATHTPVEPGSTWTIKHDINSDGEHRSGSLDPASIARTQTDAELKIKYFFDDPKEMNRFLTVGTRAIVMRSFSTGTTYELRVTMNQITPKAAPTPLEAGKLIYLEADYVPVYNTSDTQAFDVKVINAISTV